MRSKNPFVISGYEGAETFCDREKETERLIQLLENGNNVVLTAPRRIGKTDLIKHVFAQKPIRDNFFTANVDIYATRSLAEFVLFLGKAICDGLKPAGKKWVDKFLYFLHSLRTEFTFDANGMPIWSLGIGKSFHPTATLDEIFRYIEQSEQQCIIAIDEMQQIARYADGDQVEALLRTHIQQCRNARFIFAGSQQHMMAEMFSSPARPFYNSSALLSLPLIPKDVYADFCIRLFRKAGKDIEKAAVNAVYDRFQGITAYMQRLMNEMYSATEVGQCCTSESFDIALETVLNEGQDSYESLFYQLTERQRSTMLALAAENELQNPTASEFVKKYNLVSGSSVRTSIATLMDKDLITRQKDGYAIYDQFFRLWLLRRFAE